MVSAKICHGFSFIYIVMMLIWSLIDADENFTLDGVPFVNCHAWCTIMLYSSWYI